MNCKVAFLVLLATCVKYKRTAKISNHQSCYSHNKTHLTHIPRVFVPETRNSLLNMGRSMYSEYDEVYSGPSTSDPVLNNNLSSLVERLVQGAVTGRVSLTFVMFILGPLGNGLFCARRILKYPDLVIYQTNKPEFPWLNIEEIVNFR